MTATATNYAEDGEPLELLFEDLDRAMAGWDTSRRDAMLRLAAMTWADVFLTRLKMLTCADPVTGFASASHLRTHLDEAYRPGSPGRSDNLALVVIDVISIGNLDAAYSEEVFGRTLRLAVIADTLEAWSDNPGAARAALNPCRVAILIDWKSDLPRRAGDLASAITRRLLAGHGHSAQARVLRLPNDLEGADAVIKKLEPLGH